jgi:hypothetical protein
VLLVPATERGWIFEVNVSFERYNIPNYFEPSYADTFFTAIVRTKQVLEMRIGVLPLHTFPPFCDLFFTYKMCHCGDHHWIHARGPA